MQRATPTDPPRATKPGVLHAWPASHVARRECDNPRIVELRPEPCLPRVAAADPDIELVRLAQAGDRRAFELLVVRHQRRLARAISRYVHSPDDVEELTQEAFLKAYRGLHSFRGESSFATWLQRIGQYTAQSFLDAARVRPRPARPDEVEPPEAATHSLHGADPERVLMGKQIAQTVAHALERLPEAERDALLARELSGMSYDEIAARDNCPAATVRTRVFRARERIAVALRPLIDPHRGRRW